MIDHLIAGLLVVVWVAYIVMWFRSTGTHGERGRRRFCDHPAQETVTLTSARDDVVRPIWAHPGITTSVTATRCRRCGHTWGNPDAIEELEETR